MAGAERLEHEGPIEAEQNGPRLQLPTVSVPLMRHSRMLGRLPPLPPQTKPVPRQCRAPAGAELVRPLRLAGLGIMGFEVVPSLVELR